MTFNDTLPNSNRHFRFPSRPPGVAGASANGKSGLSRQTNEFKTCSLFPTPPPFVQKNRSWTQKHNPLALLPLPVPQKGGSAGWVRAITYLAAPLPISSPSPCLLLLLVLLLATKSEQLHFVD